MVFFTLIVVSESYDRFINQLPPHIIHTVQFTISYQYPERNIKMKILFRKLQVSEED